MKKIVTLIITVLCAATLFAQAPEKFSYQAVVRNASNALVTNAQVGVRVSILQGSANGNAVYVETHTASTNVNGLLTIEIGGGTVQQGSFADIDWANGPFFLETETDPNGGSDYSVTSTQQLLSVPYALYAKEAGNGFSGDYNDLTNLPQIPQIPANVSVFNNDAGYITSAEVPAQVNADWNATTGAAEILNKPTIPAVPINVSAFTNDAGYLTGYTETDPQFNAWDKDYNDLINTPTIPTIPSNVSAFTNDAGYLTNITEQQVLSISNDTIFLTGGSFVKLPAVTAGFSGDYNDLTNTPTIPQTVSELTNDANYITLEQVPTQENSDWNATSGVAQILNKPTIPTVPTDVSAFNNDAGYITNADIPEIPTVPTNISAFVNDAGYITAEQCGELDLCSLANLVADLQAQVLALQSALDSLMGQDNQDTTTAVDTATLPSVSTSSVSDITDSTATVIGIITDNGGATVISYGVCWSIEHNPTVTDSHTTDSIDASTFTSIITNLSPSTTYYVRAYATNSEGTAYGEELSFTTTVHVPDGSPCPGAPTMTDADGNVYPTVQIGNQCWTKENLRTTQNNAVHFQVGECGGSINPSCFIPRDDPSLVDTYGYLYNWAAISGRNGPVNNDSTYCQGICPDGWHVPSSFEWQDLLNYVESQPNYGWISLLDSVFVTNGTNTAPNVNRTGLSLRTSGYYFGCYMYQSSFIGQWTSSFDCGNPYPCNVEGYLYNNFMLSTGMPAYDCMSVRCLKTPDEKIFSGTVNIGDYFFSDDTLVVEITDVTANGSPITEVGACWSGGGLCINLYNAQTTPYDPSHSGPIYVKLPNVDTTNDIYFKAFINLAAGTIYSDMFIISSDTLEPHVCPSTVTDVDGNLYHTIPIGEQCWMRSNLRTTHCANGTDILTSTEMSTTIPYYYDNSSSNIPLEERGYFYNWPAAMVACPTGWHLPSDTEWTVLTDYLSAHNEYICGDNSNYIAKAIASTTGWNLSSGSCDIGTDQSTNNASGFSVIPAGTAYYNGYYGIIKFQNEGKYSSFWSSTESGTNDAWIRNVGFSFPLVYRYDFSRDNGYSVRCLRD